MSDGPGIRNQISGTVNGPVVQAGSIQQLIVNAAPGNFDGADTHAGSALAGLPPVPPGFVGRRRELRKLIDAVSGATSDRTSAICEITGMGGIGKTSLALKAAHAMVTAGAFPGGVLFLDLQGYSATPVDLAEALVILLRALGEHDYRASDISPQSGQRLFRSLLARRRRTLIVLDNIRSTAQALALLPGTDRHRVIITSRHIIGDIGARLIELNMLRSHEAADLIESTLQSARPDDRRAEHDPPAVEDLTELCTGLPLALSVAAALLVADSTQPIVELVDALRDESTRLRELSIDDQRGVHPVLTLSYARLSTAEARLFRLLSLAPGTETSSATAAALTDLPQRDVHRMLGSLRRAHMLEPGSDRGYVRFHDLLRLYAEDRLQHEDSENERAAAIARMAHYYLDAARHAIQSICGERDEFFPEQKQAAAWIHAEQDHFGFVVRTCSDVTELPCVLADTLTSLRTAEENRTYIDSVESY